MENDSVGVDSWGMFRLEDVSVGGVGGGRMNGERQGDMVCSRRGGLKQDMNAIFGG